MCSRIVNIHIVENLFSLLLYSHYYYSHYYPQEWQTSQDYIPRAVTDVFNGAINTSNVTECAVTGYYTISSPQPIPFQTEVNCTLSELKFLSCLLQVATVCLTFPPL